ncbi:hypothetical protein VPH35_043156 [Triticum aestivum]|uniref:Uncharacterized protein n=1 Tax=Triticum turgidum subsp. durum TaxID=4567 RepID=A0A9R0RD79_TRITD|nr:unnamed protein product [Triticum turgidum subsp. durum]
MHSGARAPRSCWRSAVCLTNHAHFTAKNGYHASFVPMVQDGFLADKLVRIDCKGLPKSDYRKIGVKLRDIVPCILVSFDKELLFGGGKTMMKAYRIMCTRHSLQFFN